MRSQPGEYGRVTWGVVAPPAGPLAGEQRTWVAVDNGRVSVRTGRYVGEAESHAQRADCIVKVFAKINAIEDDLEGGRERARGTRPVPISDTHSQLISEPAPQSYSTRSLHCSVQQSPLYMCVCIHCR